MSFQLMAWAVDQRTGSVTRKAVLLALANCANHQTGRCDPKIDRLAEESELNERTVRRALDDLEAAGLIERRMLHTDDGRRRGYSYSFPHLIADTESGSGGGLPDRESGDQRAESPDKNLELEPGSTPGESGKAVDLVAATWSRLAPPLIPHRDGVLRAEKTRRAIRGAFRTYAVEEVVAAVENYAAVLGGDEYLWSHRWTLVDFLHRGLDRFVADADPLRNMQRVRAKPGREHLSELEGGGF